MNDRLAMDPLLLCTDLDRTLLPNGDAPESPSARERFARVAARPEVSLVYVTGRHRESVQRAIAEYGLPTPRHAICDVGSSIYQIARGEAAREAASGGEWRISARWNRQLASAWEKDAVPAARHGRRPGGAVGCLWRGRKVRELQGGVLDHRCWYEVPVG